MDKLSLTREGIKMTSKTYRRQCDEHGRTYNVYLQDRRTQITCVIIITVSDGDDDVEDENILLPCCSIWSANLSKKLTPIDSIP